MPIMNRLDRLEIKFVLSRAQREHVLAQVRTRMEPDQNAGTKDTYPIVCLYYDSAERDCYLEKLQGVESRRKLRVRVYGSNDGHIAPTSFLEIKHRDEGRGVKRRVRMSLEAALAIGDGQRPELSMTRGEARVVEEALSLVHVRGFRQTCVVRYNRQAFAGTGAECDLRLTFDDGIACRLRNLTPCADDRAFDYPLISEDESVMEVKVTHAVPYWLAQLIGRTGCQMRGFSKYCRALEMGDPFVRGLSRGPRHPARESAPVE